MNSIAEIHAQKKVKFLRDVDKKWKVLMKVLWKLACQRQGIEAEELACFLVTAAINFIVYTCVFKVDQ